jgi:transglutaminase-like putative cysteine protease
MIFAFEHKVDNSWEDAFRSGEHDVTWIPVDAAGNEVAKGEHKYYRMGKGPNDTYQCDYDGMKLVEDRIQNGFRLFGRYYQALWD